MVLDILVLELEDHVLLLAYVTLLRCQEEDALALGHRRLASLLSSSCWVIVYSPNIMRHEDDGDESGASVLTS